MSALLVGLSWWLVTCLGIWLLLFVLDNLLRLPAGLRLPLAVGGALLALAGFVKRVFAVLAQRQRVERTAIQLERRFGIADNVLINAVQFERRDQSGPEHAFVEETIARGREQIAAIRVGDLWNRRDLWRWGTGAVLLLALWMAYVAFFPQYALNAGARFAVPLADRPPVSDIALEVSPAGDIAVIEGGTVEISALARGGSREGVAPALVWKEGAAAIEPLISAGENVLMAVVPGGERKFSHTFADVRRPFAFRVLAGDTYSRSVQVAVRPLPRIKDSFFRVTPPAYTGMAATNLPGPPAAISGLAGARVEMTLNLDSAIQGGAVRFAGAAVPLQTTNSHWQTVVVLSNAGEYEIEAAVPGLKKNVSIARGALRIEPDNPPEIDFPTTDRNRLVNLASTVRLEVEARDDFGIRAIEVTVRTPDQEAPARVARAWTFIGPPGHRGPVRESCAIEIDPAFFKPETTYLIEALAADFRPGAAPARSRPIMLRVKSLNDYQPATDDPLAAAIAHLRQTITAQERANNRVLNLKTYLDEVLQSKTLAERGKDSATRQEDAMQAGSRAFAAFRRAGAEGRHYAVKLDSLVTGEMPWALRDLRELKDLSVDRVPRQIDGIQQRQAFILGELLALLGGIADQRQSLLKTNVLAKEKDTTPMVTPEEFAKDLADDLKKFEKDQERIIEKSKALADKKPEDLTEKEEKILGEMAREEAKWAKFFEEKLTDFSKLPQQDFSDGKMGKELNEVFQEIKKAAESLYAQKTELAVPAEQSGLENAKELEQNLERWLPDSPDRAKWNMEEMTGTPADVALAELPAELEDIIGELIDKEEEMTKDVEDVSSPWLDSIDKGAGWDAADGPISSMSAKGVTGNQLPNDMEIGGRSGEGRTGKSSGQMVENTADGKGGRETPTRLDQTPFEQGSVQDSDKSSKGGATGGGKLSGTGAEGLRGQAGPQLQQKMPRLADKQAKIRQDAEALALTLRRHHLPTGDLEKSIHAMKALEDAAKKGDGLGVRRGFSHAVDALAESKKTLRAESGLHRERTRLPTWQRDEIRTGLQDGTPAGYEEIVGEYFKVLAGQGK